MDEKLLALQAELKTYFEKAAEEQKKNGTISEALTKQITALQSQVDEIDKKMAANLQSQPGQPVDYFEEQMKNDAAMQRLLKDKRGNAVITFTGKAALNIFERKTTITTGNVGNAPTTGVLPIGRLDGITSEVRQQLTIRDLLTASPTTFQVIDFVKVLTPMTIASPVAEGALKPENQLAFVSVSERVQNDRNLDSGFPANFGRYERTHDVHPDDDAVLRESGRGTANFIRRWDRRKSARSDSPGNTFQPGFAGRQAL